MKLSLPVMQCDKGCGECCGVVLCSADEFRAITKHIAARGIVPVRQGLTCPLYLHGGCSVYTVRPVVCQLYGHVPEMACPRGYNVNVPKPQARKIMAKYTPEASKDPRLIHSLVYSEAELLDLLKTEAEKK